MSKSAKKTIPFERSFASVKASKYFSKENGVDPRNLYKTSKLMYQFDCNKCGHIIFLSLQRVTRGLYCKYCVSKDLCDSPECQWCLNKSFLSHPYSKLWSPQNMISPRKVFKNSWKKYGFNCDKCNHLFFSTPANINHGNGKCSFCANRKLCTNFDCDTCNDKSFLSHPRAEFWSDENEEISRDVFLYSNKKFKFDCPECGKLYTSILCSVSYGYWCGCDKNKTETKLCDFLENNYTQITRQKKFDWCKNIKHLPFDFYMKKYNLIIELDGNQHFKKVACWECSGIKARKNDIKKMKVANDNGYSVIRIYQPDVREDKNDWEKKLKKAIKKYADVDDKDAEVKNTYIGEIYDDYPEYKSTYVK